MKNIVGGIMLFLGLVGLRIILKTFPIKYQFSMVILGDRQVGKTKLFYALTNQINVDTYPSIQSTEFTHILPFTQRLGTIYDFHCDFNLWPKKSNQILYNSIVNLIVIKDDLTYLEKLLAKDLSIRKGLTYFLVGSVTENQLKEKTRLILVKNNASEKLINRELLDIKVYKGKIEHNVSIQELVNFLQEIM